MASLVRPVFTYYTLDGKRVPAGTPGATRISERSAKWYGQGLPNLPARKRVPLATDKRAAQRMLDEMVRKAERGQAGLPDADAGRVPLAEHLDRFAEAVRLGLASRSKARRRPSDRQASLTVQRVRDALAGCGFANPADLNDDAPARLAAYLDERIALARRDGGISRQTAAFVLAAVRRFAWWLSAKAKAPVRADLFEDLPGFDPGNHRVHARRDCPPDDRARVLDAARGSARRFKHLSGADRYHLYLTAFATGYRAEELSKLTPAHFDLDADPPGVLMPGKDAKNKKRAVQPLPPGAADQLWAYLAGRAADQPVWRGMWWKHAARMLRKDLAAAGVEYVIDTPDGPKHLDFHALRHSFVSALAAKGIGPKLLQDLARHSDPRLTFAVYAHTRQDERAAAVNLLPLPGAGTNPLAALTRSELESAVVALAAAIRVILGDGLPRACTFLAPLLAPAGETGADPAGHARTDDPPGVRRGA
jgi:integrase